MSRIKFNRALLGTTALIVVSVAVNLPQPTWADPITVSTSEASVSNADTISGGETALIVTNTGSIGTFTNTGTLSGTPNGGSNNGSIGSFVNDGLISGSEKGMGNQSTITSLTNSATGTIMGGTAAGLQNDTSMGTITNAGVISSGSAGAANYGTLGLLSNSGSISGGPQGLFNSGSITSITNSGRLTAPQSAIGLSGSVGSLTNSGFIGGGSNGINLEGSLGTLVNEAGGTLGGNFALSLSGSLGGFSNSGIVSGIIVNTSSNALTISGGAGTVTGTLTGAIPSNRGSIVNTLSNLVFTGGNLLLNDNINATGHTVSNTGANLSIANSINIAGAFSQSAGTLNIDLISGRLAISGAATLSGGTIMSSFQSTGNYLVGTRTLVSATSLNLSGATVSVGSLAGLSHSVSTINNQVALTVANDYVGGTLATLNNTATITSANTGLYVATTGTIGTVTNSGTFGGAQFGVNNRGSIGSFANSGLITNSNFTAFWNQGTIGQLVNTGTISNSSWAILNSNTISTLTNSGVIAGGGNAIQNNAVITLLDNSGTMSGGSNVIAGNFGTIVNSGVMRGNVNGNGGTIGTIIGGSNGTVGTFTGASGTLQGTIGMSMPTLTFASGALLLNNSITAAGTLAASGATVLNSGADITLSTIVSVDAKFTQTAGSLNLGTAGKLAVTQAASITGGSVLVGGFSSTSTYLVGSNSRTLVSGGVGSTYTGVNVSIAGAFTGLAATASTSGTNLLMAVANNYVGDTQVSITNTATITGVTNALYVANTGSIGTFTNSGQLTGTSNGGSNNGSIGSFVNDGLISGSEKGMGNQSTITSLTNSATGTITGGTAAGLQNDTSMGTITNAGLISSGSAGFANYGTLGLLSNSGSINGGPQGIYNSGSISTISNTGRMTAPQSAIGLSGTVGSLTNSGFIGGGINGINLEGSLGTLINEAGGTLGSNTALYISGTLGGFSNSGIVSGNIVNASSRALTITGGTGTVTGTLTGANPANRGSITNTSSNLVFASGNLLVNDNINVGTNTVTNSGAALSMGSQISVTGNFSQTGGSLALSGAGKLVVSGVANLAGASITRKADCLTSGSTYLAGSVGCTLVAGGAGSDYTGATVTVAEGFDGLALVKAVDANNLLLSIGNYYVGGSYGSITNAGTISGTDTPLYVAAAGSLGSFTNSGVLDGSISGGLNKGSIGLLANSGTIMGAAGFNNISGASIATLSNLGIMTGGLGGAAIVNGGSIGSLINAQGGGSITALTYSGNLPGAYLDYVVSGSQYGQLALSSPVGTLADFEVAAGSTLSYGATYASVISGLGTVEGQDATVVGTFLQDTVLYDWNLVNVGGGVWDLVVEDLITAPTKENVTAVNQTAVVTSFAQQFDGSAVLGQLFQMRAAAEATPDESLRISSSGAPAPRMNGFAIAQGAIARYDATAETEGFDAQAIGLTFGTAHQLSDADARIGVFGSLFTSESSNQRTSDRVDSKGVGLFGDTALGGGLRLEGYLAYYRQSHDISRSLAGYVYTASPDGDAFNAYAKISSNGLKFANGLSIKPYLALSYTQQSTDAYDEAGIGDAPLQVGADSTWNAGTSIGATVSTNVQLANGMTLSPTLDAAWIHAVRDGERSVATSFLGSGDIFDATVAGVDQNYGRITASFNLSVQDNLNVSLDYTTNVMQDGYGSQGSVQLKAKLRF
ncbi:hypothetical protein HYN69_00645 [Gemmobacter aquarius]|uniref:Autotransporter domain-containing protein n=1 Tax=Paragemmobacter aquarius TaxID=2169400 RepID=A0A2S0UHB8_9RHOB|nr:hypothetical protein [Gemmobacter aquarius]AWB47209.1 hypothetical protein HYN69_00645 [Gemmobacter aquarius]